MKNRISITLEDYQINMLKKIDDYILNETDLYIPNRSALIGYLIQKEYNEKYLYNKSNK